MANITTFRLALIGFGSVGQGLAQILRDHGKWLAQHYKIVLPIVAVATTRRGNVYDPRGLDPAMLLDAVARDGHLRNVDPQVDWNPLELIARAEADVLVEVSATNLQNGEPATSYIQGAIARRMHVVTANKGPIVHHGRELAELASIAHVGLGYEGTVMAGTPALRLGWNDLAGCELLEIRGIVNGTTNYILTQMEHGMSYANALADAQQLGYAEADPSGDVEGYDAAAKAIILANMVMGAHLQWGDVVHVGITHLSLGDIFTAQGAGERWKLIAHIRRDEETVTARVYPARLPLTHPLAGVSGVTNAITFTTNLLGDVTLIGPGAGGVATGFALLSDILALHKHNLFSRQWY